MMVNFDATARETCTGQRMVSNTPLQALTTLNGPVFVEAARNLAAKLIKEQPNDEVRMTELFQAVLARSPRAKERDTLNMLLAKHLDRYQHAPDQAAKLIAVGASATPEDIKPAELAAWTSVCRVVLNLHEAMTRN